MTYTTIEPPEDLHDLVRFWWASDSPMAGTAPHRLMAETCPNIVVVRTGSFTEADGPPIASARAWDMAGRSATAPVLDGQSLDIAHWAPGLWMVELRFIDGSSKRYRVMKTLE